MAGISMPQPDPQAEKRERERTSLQDVMEMATLFFQDQLQTALGARARAYLRDRGLTGRTIETFRLGYAPDSRNALKEHLASKGVSKEQMEACGLVVHENVPVSYDRFRDRIMFPILSSREKVIAFGGRAMASDAVAKYLNSNETELFHKGNVLYNFARARRAAQAAGGIFHHSKGFGQDFIQAGGKLGIVLDLGKFRLPRRRLGAQIIVGKLLETGLNFIDAADNGTHFFYVTVVLGTKNRFEQIHNYLSVVRLK